MESSPAPASLIVFLRLIYFMYMDVFPACVCVLSVGSAFRGQESDRYPGPGVTDSCGLPLWVLRIRPGSSTRLASAPQYLSEGALQPTQPPLTYFLLFIPLVYLSGVAFCIRHMANDREMFCECIWLSIHHGRKRTWVTY